MHAIFCPDDISSARRLSLFDAYQSGLIVEEQKMKKTSPEKKSIFWTHV